jgi:hypothetical protein
MLEVRRANRFGIQQSMTYGLATRMWASARGSDLGAIGRCMQTCKQGVPYYHSCFLSDDVQNPESLQDGRSPEAAARRQGSAMRSPNARGL